jgi:hypothetical protein
LASSVSPACDLGRARPDPARLGAPLKSPYRKLSQSKITLDHARQRSHWATPKIAFVVPLHSRLSPRPEIGSWPTPALTLLLRVSRITDDSIIWVPERSLLFSGDLLFLAEPAASRPQPLCGRYREP